MVLEILPSEQEAKCDQVELLTPSSCNVRRDRKSSVSFNFDAIESKRQRQMFDEIKKDHSIRKNRRNSSCFSTESECTSENSHPCSIFSPILPAICIIFVIFFLVFIHYKFIDPYKGISMREKVQN